MGVGIGVGIAVGVGVCVGVGLGVSVGVGVAVGVGVCVGVGLGVTVGVGVGVGVGLLQATLSSKSIISKASDHRIEAAPGLNIPPLGKRMATHYIGHRAPNQGAGMSNRTNPAPHTQLYSRPTVTLSFPG